MIALDPEPSAQFSGDGAQRMADRQAQPGVLSEGFASFFEGAFKHQDLNPIVRRDLYCLSWLPYFNANAFTGLFE